ncbi:MAG: hypothetical protein MKZ95_07535 [Pirellulales bacterium]|jgi:hypothetical protein|nr:hypothetical protein [Pirellulales bacterium]|tara:strand:+ start:6452 stop:6721 length:270 start_codon:yes stop_codon:yes gene_type:complete
MRSARRLQQSSRVLKHGDDLVAALEEMKVQLVTLTTKFEEQQKIIASQSDILREINSKLTVAESHDSSSDSGVEETKAPDSDLSCTHCS